ncbi:MAG TPA: response regulator [Thermoanaerobaculia bacterium]|nr:response regulator [Thermoanaerobaculia bacterium]
MTDRLYTTNQLARLFGVVPTTVIDWIEAGKLDAFKTLGGHRRITHSAVLDFLREHELPTPPAFSELTNKILVLDDEPEVLDLLTRILRQGMPEVETLAADHPVEALLQIGAERPQVVLFDIYMPDMDGFEFCRRLNTNRSAGLVLVAISGDSSEETVNRILEAGADRFLSKTDAPSQLVSVCRELMRPRRAARRS